jgi:hypothetical protein
LVVAVRNITTRGGFWLDRNVLRSSCAEGGDHPQGTDKAFQNDERAPAGAEAMSREARDIYAEIQQGVRHLEKSIDEIQRGLRDAEHKLEADARARIRELRKDARTHLSVLKLKQREAAGALKRVSAAAGGSWADIKRTVDSVLVDARATATAAVKRFRSAFGG